ncbi:uncharacterized protein LOC105696319 isoform X2 [Orussus abietinus]|uniref:uncharacterized protein LOC105696319 isoform X2 n=1 Tax=Orussus abietinus TaxID=222816 RepID=UPI000C715C30|nr:uncharacterized protein LOC105696319 isoform X2 [Orussus abietinus]
MRYSTSELFGYAVLTLTLHFNGRAEGNVSCKDIKGRSYETGFYYIPGPEPCTLCVCENGNPKLCKAVICTLPQDSLPKQDCKSFRFGNTCCEFICMDDTLSSVVNDKPDGNLGNAGEGSANYDLGLRIVASCITIVLSLTLLFFLIHRLRQRKIRAGRQSRQLAEDQRSLGSMGYLERGGLPHGIPLDDIPCSGGYPLWKPPGNYFPRGEAPPPYEEAVAAARAEQALLSMTPHPLTPLNFQNPYLTSHNDHPNMAVTTTNNNHPNVQGGPPSLAPNPPNSHVVGSSPPISSSSRPESNPRSTHSSCHQLNQGEAPRGCPNVSTTSFNTGTNTYENLPAPMGIPIAPPRGVVHGNPSPMSNGSHSSVPRPYQPLHHTTLPRQGGAFTISATLPSAGASTHRTIPRTLATSGSLRLRREFTGHQSVVPLFDDSLKSVSPQRSPRSAPPVIPIAESGGTRTDAFYEDVLVGPPSAPPQVEGGKPPTTPPDFQPSIDQVETVDQDGSFESVACACSVQVLPTLHDDADDYRSECENCKSATGSRYYLDTEDELVTSPHETMTLHRRPEDATSGAAPQYYRTSLTLPTSTRQRTRSTGARENWFSAMPESSTESSDDD